MTEDISRRLALAGAALLWVVVASTPSAAATWGLVVGIDDYVHLPPLKGAVNDAEDVADALRASGAREIILLRDRQATREAILDGWRSIVDRADPGDTVVFSYAGHGGQEPERVPNSEDDHKDETFQLAGFNTDRTGSGERIIDDEINALFARARHLKIVFIADSCHSGTMTRGFDPRAGAVRTRMGNIGPIEEDALPPPRPQDARIEVETLDNVVYFGAVQDNELAVEIAIDGRPRGALSWSFANALRGEADANRDGVVDTQELENYLIETVRTRSEGRQFPQMAPRGSPVRLALATGRQANAAERPLSLAILGGDAEGLAARLDDVVLVGREDADLVWDVATGEMVSASGDVVSHAGLDALPAAIQPIIDKWLLLRNLAALARSRPLVLRLEPGFQRHRSGSQVTVRLTGYESNRLTLFNLAVDGTVQFLVPWPAASDERYHGNLAPGGTYTFPLKVEPPFGADHLVALVSPDGTPEFDRLLARLNGQKAAGQLRKAMNGVLEGTVFQLGYVGLLTSP